ncbi:glycosyltransferase family 1 protein [Rahnella sp. AA]|uniref:glycosyltransferase family 4 protein n=1 Tax=Rahnella sp. AA TaxID=2057180 RepID=UPI000C31D509|nr:glycosyltransferase family 1 protein [Rahnella sp. AA]PKE29248.1 glycosyltransferase family 1 protein [Rahnella sp. AA]
MRVVLDLQACQSASRFRGIGRYSMSLGKSLAKELLVRNHEVIVALSSAFPNEAQEVKAEFEASVPGVTFFEFSVITHCAANNPKNLWRQMASRMLREHALASLEPDIIHVSTLLADGWEDDLVASVGLLDTHIPTALTHYDLIPLSMSEIYLADENFRDYYMFKLDSVHRADLLLTISDFTKDEAQKYLKRPESSIINMSSAVNDDFSESLKNSLGVEKTLQKYNIKTDFLLYAPGGFDPRKNVDRLLEAYSLLPTDLRRKYNLVIASKLPPGHREGLIWKAGTLGINESELILTDYVSDADLADLYRGCRAYIFPSLQEGFGLPVLEAMSCGAVVIASDCSSIPEAHGLNDALFNPYQPDDIKDKIILALTNKEFRLRLQKHAEIQSKKFSWSTSAFIATDAIEQVVVNNRKAGTTTVRKETLPSVDELLAKMDALGLDSIPGDSDLDEFKSCFMNNVGASA